MVATPEVQLREDGCPPHLVEDVFDAREGVAVQCRLQIQGPVVSTLAEVGVVALSVLFPDHHCG